MDYSIFLWIMHLILGWPTGGLGYKSNSSYSYDFIMLKLSRNDSTYHKYKDSEGIAHHGSSMKYTMLNWNGAQAQFTSLQSIYKLPKPLCVYILLKLS